MKENYIEKTSLLILCVIVLFSSCSKNNTNQITNEYPIRRSNNQIKAIVSELGIQHNNALSKIFLKLEIASRQNESTIKSNDNSIKRQAINTNSETYYDVIINTTTDEAMNNFAYLQPSDKYSTDYIKTYVFGYHYGTILPDYNHRWNEEGVMSDQLTNIMFHVKEFLRNSTDRNQTINGLQTILDNNLGLILDENERIAFAGAIEIGINSCNYWHDNIDSWIELYPNFGNLESASLQSNILIPQQFKSNVVPKKSSGEIIKDAVFADLVGGLGGMIKGARAGVVFGAQTAAGAALFFGFVGGVSSSAGTGLWSNVQNWIGW